MAVIPPFDSDGLLPPDDYEVSFDELRRSPLVLGLADVRLSPKLALVAFAVAYTLWRRGRLGRPPPNSKPAPASPP